MIDWKFLIPILAVGINLVLALYRAHQGPTVFDRILGGNMFGTKTILLIVVAGFFFERPEWVDLALVYALMNFIAIIAILRYVKFGTLAEVKKARAEGRIP